MYVLYARFYSAMFHKEHNPKPEQSKTQKYPDGSGTAARSCPTPHSLSRPSRCRKQGVSHHAKQGPVTLICSHAIAAKINPSLAARSAVAKPTYPGGTARILGCTTLKHSIRLNLG